MEHKFKIGDHVTFDNRNGVVIDINEEGAPVGGTMYVVELDGSASKASSVWFCSVHCLQLTVTEADVQNMRIGLLKLAGIV